MHKWYFCVFLLEVNNLCCIDHVLYVLETMVHTCPHHQSTHTHQHHGEWWGIIICLCVLFLQCILLTNAHNTWSLMHIRCIQFLKGFRENTYWLCGVHGVFLFFSPFSSFIYTIQLWDGPLEGDDAFDSSCFPRLLMCTHTFVCKQCCGKVYRSRVSKLVHCL